MSLKIITTYYIPFFITLFSLNIQAASSAQPGDPYALYLQGAAYAQVQDTSKAIALYTAAADNGVTIAMCELARMHLSGTHDHADPAEAERLFRVAAGKGNRFAQFELGALLEVQGRPEAEYMELYSLSAAQYHEAAIRRLAEGAKVPAVAPYPAAETLAIVPYPRPSLELLKHYNVLGCMHATGNGVPQDIRMAETCLLYAANYGFSEAQYNLACLYQTYMPWVNPTIISGLFAAARQNYLYAPLPTALPASAPIVTVAAPILPMPAAAEDAAVPVPSAVEVLESVVPSPKTEEIPAPIARAKPMSFPAAATRELPPSVASEVPARDKVAKRPVPKTVAISPSAEEWTTIPNRKPLHGQPPKIPVVSQKPAKPASIIGSETSSELAPEVDTVSSPSSVGTVHMDAHDKGSAGSTTPTNISMDSADSAESAPVATVSEDLEDATKAPAQLSAKKPKKPKGKKGKAHKKPEAESILEIPEPAAVSAVPAVSASKLSADIEREYVLGLRCVQSEDFKKAFLHFEKAAKAGHTNAEFSLGNCYYAGKGAMVDYAQAVEWYKRAAKKDHVAAQFNLGSCYEKGTGVVCNPEEAVRLYKIAAEGGSAEAQFNLGICYKMGQGAPQDLTEAVRYYQLAADQGFVLAEFNLGACYKKGEGVPQNPVEAVKWIRKAAEKGFAEALSVLGWCYEVGEGTGQDLSKACKYYKDAATQGHAGAQFNLSNCYAQGRGVPQDDTKAFHWMKKAAISGIPEAEYFMGTVYKNGTKIPVDLKVAFAWFEKAATKGYAQAQFELGCCYENGRGVRKDLVQAMEWYGRAGEQKHEAATFRVAAIADLFNMKVMASTLAQAGPGGMRDTLGALQALAGPGMTITRLPDGEPAAAGAGGPSQDAKKAVVHYKLGLAYETGDKVDRDFDQAVKHFTIAAELGHAEAKKSLAGFAFAKKVFDACKVAAEEGNSVAQTRLGALYADGKGVAKNEDEAVRWFKAAAEHKDIEAQHNLGFCYMQGKGVEKNEEEALKWFLLAASRGYAAAQYNAGLLYHHGRGTSVDLEAARHWYECAAAQRHAMAMAVLKFLNAPSISASGT